MDLYSIHQEWIFPYEDFPNLLNASELMKNKPNL